jgi:hypothetical protein
MTRARHTLPFYALWAGHLTAVSRAARPQGGRPAAVFYPFGHPTPYTYDVWPLVFHPRLLEFPSTFLHLVHLLFLGLESVGPASRGHQRNFPELEEPCHGSESEFADWTQVEVGLDALGVAMIRQTLSGK